MHTRQRKILDLLQAGPLSIREAARILEVTEMTIRRDIRILEEQRLLLAVKGKVMPYPVNYRTVSGDVGGQAVKNAIAEACYRECGTADSFFIGSGTTVLAFAHLLAYRAGGAKTVITNSLSVASALFQSRCRVILLGGELRAESMDLVGAAADRAIGEYHVDCLISGADGILPDYGYYTSDVNLSSLERRTIEIADRTVILADSGKFGKKSLVRFAPLEAAHLVITDAGIPEDALRQLREAGVAVVTA